MPNILGAVGKIRGLEVGGWGGPGKGCGGRSGPRSCCLSASGCAAFPSPEILIGSHFYFYYYYFVVIQLCFFVKSLFVFVYFMYLFFFMLFFYVIFFYM